MNKYSSQQVIGAAETMTYPVIDSPPLDQQHGINVGRQVLYAAQGMFFEVTSSEYSSSVADGGEPNVTAKLNHNVTQSVYRTGILDGGVTVEVPIEDTSMGSRLALANEAIENGTVLSSVEIKAMYGPDNVKLRVYTGKFLGLVLLRTDARVEASTIGDPNYIDLTQFDEGSIDRRLGSWVGRPLYNFHDTMLLDGTLGGWRMKDDVIDLIGESTSILAPPTEQSGVSTVQCTLTGVLYPGTNIGDQRPYISNDPEFARSIEQQVLGVISLLGSDGMDISIN